MLPYGGTQPPTIGSTMNLVGRMAAGLTIVAALVLAAANPSSAAKQLSITGPTISDVTDTSAVISWSTNRRSTGVVRFGPTPSYGTEVSSTANSTSHSVTLTGLTAGTTYYVQIEARSNGGRMATASDSFDTAMGPPPPPPPPAATCLDSPTTTTIDDTWAGQSIVGRIRPGDLDPGTGLDLRGMTLSVHDRSQDAVVDGRPVIDSRWGLVQTDSSVDLCVVGGEIISPNPSSITWDENYDRDGLGFGYRLGTTRNHTGHRCGRGDPADGQRPLLLQPS